MQHECKFEDKIIEMHGDVKSLVTEFRAMNGRIVDTIDELDRIKTESKPYIQKVNIMWTGLHFSKYIIMLIFSSGLILYVLQTFTNK